MATVRPADAGDVTALSAAFADAFVDEPLVNWLLPHTTRRTVRRRELFALELQSWALPRGGLVFTAEGARRTLAGGCLTLPPEQWRMPTSVDGRTAVRWLVTLGPKVPRATRSARAMQERHLGEPHYYLRWLGVRRRLQGQGLGTALLRSTLDRVDAEGLPAYLEASNERSAALFERFGFVHQGVLDLPDGGPTVWPMRRPARGDPR